MPNMMTRTHLMALLFGTTLLILVSCAETMSIEDARTTYFTTVVGSGESCQGWLDWCIAHGYPRADCEERNQYCVDGEWIGGDREDDESSAGPCAETAEAAYTDCINAGGTDEECSERAEAAYEDCTGNDQVDNEDSSDPCAERAESAYIDCINAGGTDEECSERAEAAYEDCIGQ